MKFLLEHATAALFLDPGLGKTSVTLAAIKFLKSRGLINKVLLIAPLRVCYSVWPVEAQLWEDFNGLKIALLHGPHKNEALEEEADIYVINPEGLEWLMQCMKRRSPVKGRVSVTVDLKRWRELGFDTLVVDELSKFKHPNTVRFKTLKQVVPYFSRRWGLTGSPASNGLMDLFGEYYILDQGRSLGPFITHYRNRYFELDYDGYTWKLKEGAEKEIYKRLKPLTLRMAAEDYLEMPQLVKNNIYVDLPGPAADVYARLESELIAKIKDRTVVARNAAAASTKCRQVANGGVYLDPEIMDCLPAVKQKREWADLHEAKLDALEDLVEELQSQPLLVAYDFEHDLARLKKRFPHAPHIGGGVSGKASKIIEDKWNAGKIPVLFAHPQSVAHGLNLQQACKNVCWHSPTWDFELYDQLNRRVYRQGNTAKQVFIHHILARGTIDEDIVGALNSKKRGQDALFEALTSKAVRRQTVKKY